MGKEVVAQLSAVNCAIDLHNRLTIVADYRLKSRFGGIEQSATDMISIKDGNPELAKEATHAALTRGDPSGQPDNGVS